VNGPVRSQDSGRPDIFYEGMDNLLAQGGKRLSGQGANVTAVTYSTRASLSFNVLSARADLLSNHLHVVLLFWTSFAFCYSYNHIENRIYTKLYSF
jgi:hypothetical protein